MASQMKYPIIDNKYLLTDYLSYGGSSKVFKGECSEGELVMKIIRKDKNFTREEEMEFVKHECDILQNLQNHPNIVNLIDSNLVGKQTYCNDFTEISYAALEYCSNGTLYDFVKIKSLGKLNLDVIRFYFIQLAFTLKYLHDNNTAHLDIKPGNILLDSNFNLKLSDFGVAYQTKTKNTMIRHKVGTKAYLALEIQNTAEGTFYNPFKADVYSLGVLLSFLVYGEIPKKNADASAASSSIFSEKTQASDDDCLDLSSSTKDFDMEIEDNNKMDLANFISSMLIEDPKLRPSIDEVLENEFVCGNLPSDIGSLVYMEMSDRKAHISS